MGDEPTVFTYERPERVDRPKVIEPLCRSELLNGQVQIVREDGANNLHSHSGNEGFWMVLSGSARFYTKDDREIASLERYEGIHVPLDYPYWFESTGDEPLEILHVSAYAETVDDRRTDYESVPSWREEVGG